MLSSLLHASSRCKLSAMLHVLSAGQHSVVPTLPNRDKIKEDLILASALLQPGQNQHICLSAQIHASFDCSNHVLLAAQLQDPPGSKLAGLQATNLPQIRL